MADIWLTPEEITKREERLEILKTTRRLEIAEQLKIARAFGDLSENAEYDAAKERQGFIEGRIKELESKLSFAQIIDPTATDVDGRIVFGATVTLLDCDNEEESCYQIVGEDEADIKAGKISFNSPIARALIGKEEGDTVLVDAPGGQRELEVVSVQYI